jgi:two-component system sensor histidine kinase YesM
VEYLKDTINKLYRSVTYNLSSDAFSKAYTRIVDPDANIPFPTLYMNMQTGIDALKRSSELIDSVAVLGCNGEFFSSYEIGLKHDSRRLSIWGDGIPDSIRWLPTAKNPFFPGAADVVTVQFPVSFNPGLFLSMEKVMMLTVLLDSRRLERELKRMNKTTSSLFYLADGSGLPLSLSREERFSDIVSSDRFRAEVTASRSRRFFNYAAEGTSFKVATEDLGISGLRVVSFMSENALNEGKRKILGLALAVMIAGGFLALLISFLLARSITDPIYRLVGKVGRIESGDYETPDVIAYADEMRILDRFIGRMALTIKAQLTRIQVETQLKRKAEIEALAEQVNPHFLYNTLDVVRWEILAGEAETASAMIEDLGDFLRIGLNYGAEYITMEEEFRHVDKYMRIMNRRLDRQVRFSSFLSPETAQIPILRLLLQPLAENAIRHGFNPGMEDPYMELRAVLEDDRSVTITVEDNGKGFDAGELRIITDRKLATELRHVGLHNINSRLANAYGENAGIDFESIPFVRNRIILHLPVSTTPTV